MTLASRPPINFRARVMQLEHIELAGMVPAVHRDGSSELILTTIAPDTNSYVGIHCETPRPERTGGWGEEIDPTSQA
jgi:hypothetical protein